MILQQRSNDNSPIIEVDERSFQSAVLERSHDVPVVVDFWAPWCGPCRTLGPILERLAQEAKGRFILAKINVDQNPSLASAFRVQGIPAVKAVRNGKIVTEFTGAQPEARVRAWLQQLLPPSADQMAAEIETLETSNPQAAIAHYQKLLASEPNDASGLLGLGRMLVRSGDPKGIDLLKQVPSGTLQYSRAQAWLTLTSFMEEAGEHSINMLTDQLERTPNDPEARYRLAARLTREQRYSDAMSHLLTIVERNRAFRDDGARKMLLALFEALGSQEPAVVEYRRKLANALF